VRFLLPFRSLRRRPVQRITALIRDELSRKPDRLSIVGHSFGTFIISKILEEEADIKFDRILLCGSIIPDSFPWERFGHRIAPNEKLEWQVLNDCGMNDPLPVLAQSVTWGYGSSGRFGFGHVRVKDRFHTVGHSGFFSETFVRDYWLPYLSKGEVVEGKLDLPTAPWWLSILTVLKLRYAVVATAFLALFLATRQPGLNDRLPSPCPFPARPNRQQAYGQHAGCKCGTVDVAIEPNPVPFRSGSPILIAYDNSPICQGQGVATFDGTVDWGDGALQKLGSSYGCMTHKYLDDRPHQISIQMEATCVDDRGTESRLDDCANTCAGTGKALAEPSSGG
jgi:hypothetical protein